MVKNYIKEIENALYDHLSFGKCQVPAGVQSAAALVNLPGGLNITQPIKPLGLSGRLEYIHNTTAYDWQASLYYRNVVEIVPGMKNTIFYTRVFIALFEENK